MIKSFIIVALAFTSILLQAQVALYVSPGGSDTNSGSKIKPFRSLTAAVIHAVAFKGKDVTIILRGGTYYPDSTIVIGDTNFLLKSLHIEAYKNEQATIAGSTPVKLQWTPYKNGIFQAAFDFKIIPDRFFMGGINLPMARYPNYDSTARVFNGVAADAVAASRVAGWKHPEGGYLHALHQGEWGGFHFLITGKSSDSTLTMEGGWQNNRPAPLHPEYRFVENIFEELDAPGEWFYDRQAKIIYFYPPAGTAIDSADFAYSHLDNLLVIKGTQGKPVKNITISNIRFTATNRSFMLTKEPLLKSDWTIYRGGAILLDETENIKINSCIFENLGGNAVFLSNYNKRDTISCNHIYNIGGGGIAFVGNAAAVRSPSFNYNQSVPWNETDLTPGPKTDDYPQYCVAGGNLIHDIGLVEKQVAGIEISMSSHITVAHNTIYTVPRAGINIGDGCWGGHILEFNDVFNTVLETGDHGAFNSWGRDRYWRPDRSEIDSIVAAKPGIELLDVRAPVIIRNNRFQCDHGWDIDLDDGSSNYQIYNNICLSGGLKLREGYNRVVTNNIIVNNSFHPHVWLKNSEDVFTHNIITTAYAPILMDHWGKQVDKNFFIFKEGLIKAQALGLDAHSHFGDPMFSNPAKNDYRLKTGSPALKTGFKNIASSPGVLDAGLKAIAKQPSYRPLLTTLKDRKGVQIIWLGITLKNVETIGERSAAGLPNNNGALVVGAAAPGVAKNDFRKGDVITMIGGIPVNSIKELLLAFEKIKWKGGADCTIVRNQSAQQLRVSFK